MRIRRVNGKGKKIGIGMKGSNGKVGKRTRMGRKFEKRKVE